ncbi:MAG: asparaginase [Candidatus Liptonbacteria bacterium]|nr:asparaginase [Candidatus Liptonbacteria bacterium]
MRKRKVIILGFGGTIAMVPDAHGVLKPAKGVDEILAIVPSLKEMADISLRQLENRDSTNINPNHWTNLALAIQEIHGQVDGIIVTHGTDTMAYTASAISLALGRGLKIPVVFTGSQLPLIAYGTDARFNLENSMKTVLRACEERIAEVMIVFSERVMRASRAIKTSEASFHAFDSPAFPRLARVDAIGVHFIPEVLKVDEDAPLNVLPNFEHGIFAIDLLPGLEPEILFGVLRSGKCRGLLFKSLGAGNVPSEEGYSLLPVIREAVGTLKIPVLVSTKFVGGKVHMEMYEPGKLALEAGAIPTGDLTDVMAQVKLMWALAQGYTSMEDLKNIINTNIVGEITA